MFYHYIFVSPLPCPIQSISLPNGCLNICLVSYACLAFSVSTIPHIWIWLWDNFPTANPTQNWLYCTLLHTADNYHYSLLPQQMQSGNHQTNSNGQVQLQKSLTLAANGVLQTPSRVRNGITLAQKAHLCQRTHLNCMKVSRPFRNRTLQMRQRTYHPPLGCRSELQR